MKLAASKAGPYTPKSRIQNKAPYTSAHRTGSGQYEDEQGNKYYQTANGLYVREDTNVTYSTNPDEWNLDDELEEQDALEEIERNAQDKTEGEMPEEDLDENQEAE